MCVYLQGSLRYHAAKPTGQVTPNVINFLCILTSGAILIGVWMVLYYINTTAFTLALFSALFLNTTHQHVLLTMCTRGALQIKGVNNAENKTGYKYTVT